MKGMKGNEGHEEELFLETFFERTSIKELL
jgi:hypothetical protein